MAGFEVTLYGRIWVTPESNNTSAQTDALRNAEMLSYSRSRDLLAAISLEGATLRPDE